MSDTQRRKQKTGLGTAALFQTPSANQQLSTQQETETAEPPSTSQPVEKQQEAVEAKVKTTVNLSAETLALLDALKIQARKQKRKATYSDILDEAIRELAKQKGIET